VLLLIGMFIEAAAAIIVLAPILVPVAVTLGIDPVHFGLVMIVALAIGFITPPFGLNLFAACTSRSCRCSGSSRRPSPSSAWWCCA
jgi:C4-dicarboxylate transporter, DctM subunit